MLKWHLNTTVDGVKFYHAIAICNGAKTAFLKLHNTNAYKVNVSWKEVFTIQENNKQEGFAGKKSVVLPPGELSETDCASPVNKNLIVLPNEVNPMLIAEIEDVTYREIAVTKAK